MHWEADGALPDFYLGDLADASFADSKYTCRTLEETTALVGRPVNDLHNFWLGLTPVVDMAGARRGHDSPGVLALRRLEAGMSAVVMGWKEASDAPPDLSELIRGAEQVEIEFGKGGVTDETGTEDYAKFVTVVRNNALKVEREGAMVVRTRRKGQALKPMDTSAARSVPVPLAIHGPWRLFKSVDANKWVPAEGRGVTHHRPNRVQVGDEELSNTKKIPGLFAPVFMELEGSDKGDDSDGSFSSKDSSGQKTIRPPSFATSSVSLAPSLANPLAARDDALELQDASPGNVSEKSPSLLSAEGNDGDFDTECFLSRSTAADLPPFDWRLTYSDGARLAAVHQPVSQAGKQQPSTRTGKGKVTGVAPEQIQDTLKLWHALVHGARCECSEEVWMGAVEATLRGARMRRVMRGRKQASLPFEDPKF